MLDLNYRNDEAYQQWKRLMELGERTGCHQKPERSFYIHGYQMPVCARCTGVFLGYLLAIPAFIRWGFLIAPSLLGALSMLVDWLLQSSKITRSNNIRRFITGMLGGFGIMSFQLKLMKRLTMRQGQSKIPTSM